MAYDVRQIQTLLNKFGYGLAVDGANGPKTQAAIRDFQSKHSLAVDGVVGPQTWGALNGQASANPGYATTDSQGIASAYPQYAYLVNDPEVGPLLQQAYSEKWPSNELVARLEATNWWRSTSDSVRNYNFLANTDPAQLQQNIQSVADHLTDIARSLGMGVRPETFYDLAKQAVQFGWSEEHMRDVLAHTPGTTFGDNSPVIAQIRQAASEYMIPLSEGTITQWARDIGSGTSSIENFTGYLKEQAKSLFPSLAAAIDQGVTVQQYVEPYKQIAAQTLEVAPTSINMMDPKWNRALNQVDPKTGERTSMTLYDWQALMRTDPQYQYDKTSGARTEAANLTTKLAQEFGAIS